MESILKNTLKGGQFTDVSPLRSRNMQRIKSKENRTTEVKLRMTLVRAKLKNWLVRPKNIIGNPDFVFKEERLAIFVDGCFWHGCKKCYRKPATNRKYWNMKILRNRRRDIILSRLLNDQGIRVLRIWEHELQHDVDSCIKRISALLTK